MSTTAAAVNQSQSQPPSRHHRTRSNSRTRKSNRSSRRNSSAQRPIYDHSENQERAFSVSDERRASAMQHGVERLAQRRQSARGDEDMYQAASTSDQENSAFNEHISLLKDSVVQASASQSTDITADDSIRQMVPDDEDDSPQVVLLNTNQKVATFQIMTSGRSRLTVANFIRMLPSTAEVELPNQFMVSLPVRLPRRYCWSFGCCSSRPKSLVVHHAPEPTVAGDDLHPTSGSNAPLLSRSRCKFLACGYSKRNGGCGAPQVVFWILATLTFLAVAFAMIFKYAV